MDEYTTPSEVKASLPIKAKPLDPDEEDAFWEGRLPRQLLAIPFGGPIKSVIWPRGVDLDGQTFTENTDIFGGIKALRESSERLTDFHHSYAPPGKGYGDPTGMMSGHLIGKSILHPDPDEDGWWVDFWVKAGDARVKLIRRIAERGAQLFGSSQPAKGVLIDGNGEIKVWPYVLQTLSTSPQNTHSVLRPKALLDGLNESGLDIHDGLRSLIVELDALSSHLPPTSSESQETAKAGRAVVDDFTAAVERLEGLVR